MNLWNWILLKWEYSHAYDEQIKRYAMKTYWEMELENHIFLASDIVGYFTVADYKNIHTLVKCLKSDLQEDL
jgi:hypothetical protein